METTDPTTQWKTWIAFGIIYFVWGSTFYAIRVGVHQMPPLVLAAARFSTAGLLLCAYACVRGERLPTRRQWSGIAVLSFLIFVVDYGILFWAEQRVPSGMAAVVLAIVPVFMTLAEIIVLRTQRLTPRLTVALLIGLGGVVVLIDPSVDVGGAPIYTIGAAALVLSALSWSIASVLSRLLPLPSSKLMSAGAQMLLGGLLLTAAATALGQVRHFHPQAVSAGGWLSLLYLTFAGSLVGFTAYTWLIHRVSPTKVGTYAYVNPLVAVVIGYFLGGEAVDARTVLGTVFIMVSVIVITTRRAGAATPLRQAPAVPQDGRP